MCMLEYEKHCLKTLVLKLGFTLESPGEFLKLLRPGPTPRDSDFIDWKYCLDTGIFKSSLDDCNRSKI